MSGKTKALIWYGATAVFAVFGFIWTVVGNEPTSWPGIVAIAGTILSAVLGYTFTPPKPPTP